LRASTRITARSAVGREEPIGHVDRDALHAFSNQPIDDEPEVERAAPRAQLLGIDLEGGQLVFEEKSRLVE
jgi:hypothetical protein